MENQLAARRCRVDGFLQALETYTVLLQFRYTKIEPRPLTEQESTWIREILQANEEWKDTDEMPFDGDAVCTTVRRSFAFGDHNVSCP